MTETPTVQRLGGWPGGAAGGEAKSTGALTFAAYGTSLRELRARRRRARHRPSGVPDPRDMGHARLLAHGGSSRALVLFVSVAVPARGRRRGLRPGGQPRRPTRNVRAR